MFVAPMLLHKTNEPFDDDSYITELKLDGIRLILTKFGNKVKLYTRHKNEATAKFPELLTIDIPNGTVLDGEIIVSDSSVKPDFEANDVPVPIKTNQPGKLYFKLCGF